MKITFFDDKELQRVMAGRQMLIRIDKGRTE